MTWRGVLTKIMATPYNTFDKWNICAVKYKGTIYLAEYKTEAQHLEQDQKPAWVKKTMFWGRKVEQFLCADKEEPPKPEEPVNENAEYVSVLRSQLGQIQLLYGAEVDCVDPTTEYPSPANYVEIKTQEMLKDKIKKTNFRKFKLCKWWAQSYLAGIPRVMTGFRDYRGYVTNLAILETQQMPKLAAQENYAWTVEVMTGFLEKFLTHIRDLMAKVEDVLYVFEWNPEWEGVTFTFVADHRPGLYFIPDWYKEHIEEEAWKLREAKIKKRLEASKEVIAIDNEQEAGPIVIDSANPTDPTTLQDFQGPKRPKLDTPAETIVLD